MEFIQITKPEHIRYVDGFTGALNQTQPFRVIRDLPLLSTNIAATLGPEKTALLKYVHNQSGIWGNLGEYDIHKHGILTTLCIYAFQIGASGKDLNRLTIQKHPDNWTGYIYSNGDPRLIVSNVNPHSVVRGLGL